MRVQFTSLSDVAAHRDLQSERRKEQNRNAQRRLRERREQYAHQLENEVHQLHLKCRQHETENQHLTELLKRVNDQHGTIMDQFMSAYNEVPLCKGCGTAVQRSSSTDLSRSHQSPTHTRPSGSQNDACVTQAPVIRQRAIKSLTTSSNITTSSERSPIAPGPIARKACRDDRGGKAIGKSSDSTVPRAMDTTFSTPEHRRAGTSDEIHQRKKAVREGEISHAPVPLLDLSKLKLPSMTKETATTGHSIDVPRAPHLQQGPAELDVWLMHKQLSASSWQSGKLLEVKDSSPRTSCTGDTLSRDATISGPSQKEAFFSMSLHDIGLTPDACSSASGGNGIAGDGPTLTDGSDMHRAETVLPWSQLLQVPLERELSFNA